MTDNSEPAFPVSYPVDSKGMSLLDWLAGQALTGLVAKIGLSSRHSDLATEAYKFADAMLYEKQKRATK